VNRIERWATTALRAAHRNSLLEAPIRTFEARAGRIDRHLLYLKEHRQRPDLRTAIARLRDTRGVSVPDDGRDPVLVLSASWRSGSTLVQRLLVSSGKLLVWGEPYRRAAQIPRLAESLIMFGAAGWPPPEFVLDRAEASDPAALAGTWIANIYPPALDLVCSHRELFFRQFEEPARRFGYARWGIKEVTWGRDEIDYLKLLFPRARFILLARDPIACWSSQSGMGVLYNRWPEEPVVSPKRFAAQWSRLVTDFVNAAHDDPHCLLLRYEDVQAGTAVAAEIARFADVDVDETVLENVQRGIESARRPVPAPTVRIIRRATEKAAAALERAAWTG
jgi:hypothetical protein